jgi:hypothetical protein
MKDWVKNLEVEIEGLKLKLCKDEIKPGDMYVAERNSGPKLLECEKVVEDQGYIVPKMNADGKVEYPYDIWECRKVERIIE